MQNALSGVVLRGGDLWLLCELMVKDSSCPAYGPHTPRMDPCFCLGCNFFPGKEGKFPISSYAATMETNQPRNYLVELGHANLALPTARQDVSINWKSAIRLRYNPIGAEEREMETNATTSGQKLRKK